MFKAVDILKDCNIIILTSDNDVSEVSKTVPEKTIVIHKDADFYEKLTDQLIDWGLFGDIG
mgnify:CR=1 FL=1